MKRRQTFPSEWLIIDGQQLTTETRQSIRRLPRGRGVIVLGDLPQGERRRLRTLAAARGLDIVDEAKEATARVHDLQELRRALLRRTPLVLLSPMYPTPSHPDWRPQPRMRAATLARLAGRKLFALGGMNRKRYAKIAPLGFIGWAGISAFRT